MIGPRWKSNEKTDPAALAEARRLGDALAAMKRCGDEHEQALATRIAVTADAHAARTTDQQTDCS